MVNKELLTILRCPQDGSNLNENLQSSNGTSYDKTESGVLLMLTEKKKPSDSVYRSYPFRDWNRIINDRIDYYTKKTSIAGRLAHWSYRGLEYFNKRNKGEWLVDIGCGDGAQIANLRDRSTYIGIDRNLERLEILKRNFPEATAIYADAAELPFADGSIQHVFSSNAFEHMWYLRDTALELLRITAPQALIRIVVPTEGGAWTLGRKLISRPHYKKRHPHIDFDFISHVEHCNNARQIVRTMETFFHASTSYIPFRLPFISINALLQIDCRPRPSVRSYFSLQK